MRKTILALAASLGLVSVNAFADTKALTSVQNGIAGLSEEQQLQLSDEQYNMILNATDEELPAVVAEIIASISKSTLDVAKKEELVSSILIALMQAKPELSDLISQAVIAAAPEMETVVLTASLEATPTAAGPDGAENQTQQTSPDNNVVATVTPPPAGGGPAVSPN
ncbi:hypothetical protein J3998_02115 [Thiomicrorhabdus sp. 6S2-11]|uniref:Uncharacterized protein n=1 Tax=Thiomicrorhabdus marina TaxID=2818442 RepID=A0ABS3Q216_9GAMM|nr:hypothetical protein [Thiomicrorhabdus marina]MBO1926359.1 hypothetical protein [Thiomicrorhabdus marina]